MDHWAHDLRKTLPITLYWSTFSSSQTHSHQVSDTIFTQRCVHVRGGLKHVAVSQPIPDRKKPAAEGQSRGGVPRSLSSPDPWRAPLQQGRYHLWTHPQGGYAGFCGPHAHTCDDEPDFRLKTLLSHHISWRTSLAQPSTAAVLVLMSRAHVWGKRASPCWAQSQRCGQN